MKKLQKWRIAQWLSEIRKGGGKKKGRYHYKATILNF